MVFGFPLCIEYGEFGKQKVRWISVELANKNRPTFLIPTRQYGTDKKPYHCKPKPIKYLATDMQAIMQIAPVTVTKLQNKLDTGKEEL